MRLEPYCPNLNHGRQNAPIQFCPSCGKTVSNKVHARCDEQKHSARRKDRDHFCVDCGKSLRSL